MDDSKRLTNGTMFTPGLSGLLPPIRTPYPDVKTQDVLRGQDSQISRQRLLFDELLSGDDAHPARLAQLIEGEQVAKVHFLERATANIRTAQQTGGGSPKTPGSLVFRALKCMTMISLRRPPSSSPAVVKGLCRIYILIVHIQPSKRVLDHAGPTRQHELYHTGSGIDLPCL